MGDRERCGTHIVHVYLPFVVDVGPNAHYHEFSIYDMVIVYCKSRVKALFCFAWVTVADGPVGRAFDACLDTNEGDFN